MSIAHILNNARGALHAAELGIQIAGHNVANANTPGYSRQRLDLRPAPGVRTPIGYMGGGVEIAGWDRIRNSLADSVLRREMGVAAEYEQRLSVLLQVESAMSEMGDAGLSESLNGFFNAWSELSVNPTGSAQREQVRQRAEVVVQRLNNIDSRLDAITSEMEDATRGETRRLNEMTSEVARLNEAVVKAEANGASAPDLRDARDQVIDEMSALLDLQVIEQQDGSVTIVSGNTVLVDRGRATQVDLALVGTTYELQESLSGNTLRTAGGRIGGGLALLNTDLPDFRAELDALVAGVVGEVNAIHVAGTTLAGASGIDFFDPAGTTAGSIQLSAAVVASRDNIVAGYSGDAGDGTAAGDLERLRYEGQAVFGGDSVMEAALSVSVTLGLSISNASDIVEAQGALVSDLEQQRASVSGVSTEEEMMSLMQFQYAYQAASRVVVAVDEMMRTLLEIA